MPQVNIKIENLSLEAMGLAILSSLRAAARAHYQAMNVGWALTQVARGQSEGNALAPGPMRRGWMNLAYDEVLKFLPDDSPFRNALAEYQRAEIQSIKDYEVLDIALAPTPPEGYAKLAGLTVSYVGMTPTQVEAVVRNPGSVAVALRERIKQALADEKYIASIPDDALVYTIDSVAPQTHSPSGAQAQLSIWFKGDRALVRPGLGLKEVR